MRPPLGKFNLLAHSSCSNCLLLLQGKAGILEKSRLFFKSEKVVPPGKRETQLPVHQTGD
jgi:hypothetical protein